MRGGALYLEYGRGLVGPLAHWHYDTFRATWDARWRGSELVTFVIDDHGKPSTLKVGGDAFERTKD